MSISEPFSILLGEISVGYMSKPIYLAPRDAFYCWQPESLGHCQLNLRMTGVLALIATQSDE